MMTVMMLKGGHFGLGSVICSQVCYGFLCRRHLEGTRQALI